MGAPKHRRIKVQWHRGRRSTKVQRLWTLKAPKHQGTKALRCRSTEGIDAGSICAPRRRGSKVTMHRGQRKHQCRKRLSTEGTEAPRLCGTKCIKHRVRPSTEAQRHRDKGFEALRH
ncbi:UNVERIFIED_CONTAM: hypothetical protein FKN15_073150 [Acipenser sinensis]